MAKSYQLSYYPELCEVEMYDIKNRRMFLKRCKYEDLQADQLYIGSTITVYGRQLKLVEYGDEFTRNSLESNSERTIAVVPPAGMPYLGKITNAIVRSRFIISEMRMVQLSKAEAEEFAGGNAALAQTLVSGASSVLEIMGNNAIGSWLNLLGPPSNPKSLEAVFGVQCYGSADAAAAFASAGSAWTRTSCSAPSEAFASVASTAVAAAIADCAQGNGGWNMPREQGRHANTRTTRRVR